MEKSGKHMQTHRKEEGDKERLEEGGREWERKRERNSERERKVKLEWRVTGFPGKNFSIHYPLIFLLPMSTFKNIYSLFYLAIFISKSHSFNFKKFAQRIMKADQAK